MMIVVGGFSGLRWVGVGWCNALMRVGVDKGRVETGLVGMVGVGVGNGGWIVGKGFNRIFARNVLLLLLKGPCLLSCSVGSVDFVDFVDIAAGIAVDELYSYSLVQHSY